MSQNRSPLHKHFKYPLFLLLLACKFHLSTGVNTLSRGQTLSGNQTLLSQDRTFELGFFTTGRSNYIYLGIWYQGLEQKTVVWVANREEAISNTSRNSRLEISEDGNLLLQNESGTVWSTNLVSSPPRSSEAVLLDNGNFALRESSNSSNLFWQSFDFPTDTWLPGGKLGYKKLSVNNQQIFEFQRLVSWKSSDDPSSGMFSVAISTDTLSGMLIQWNKTVSYWNSGTWNIPGLFASLPELKNSINMTFVSHQNETYYTYSLFEKDAAPWRFTMDASGQLKLIQVVRSLGFGVPGLTFAVPEDQSQVYAVCGEFGVFTRNPSSSCICLPGFKSINDGLPGCLRETALQCENTTTPTAKKDGFQGISNIKFPAISNSHPAQNVEGCRSACQENCSCTAYSYNGSVCSVWTGALFDIKQLSDVIDAKKVLFLKVATSGPQDAAGEPATVSGNKRKMIITVAVAAPVLGGFIWFVLRKIRQRGSEKKEISEDLLSFDFTASTSTASEIQMKNANDVRNKSKSGFDLPLFSYASVSAATDNFSEGKKLGEGGFGPVYKGKSLKGQEIAVKRLSRGSGQGLKEFRNEILLIAKLQHRNLVRLFGCCIEQGENILIYEYMPNKSLDSFLFDPDRQVALEWETRISIVQGIAQGLLYLHEYSRLRIIHRDLKASNILLDSDMNPKISDFGMARIFGGNDSETNTRRIVGTYGYMAPEYALEGLFSIKSDVFSFGVLVLEIVSGKKNTGFFNSDSLNLLGHAWELWNSNRALEIMDPSLGCPPAVAVLRCINIGLLCVHEKPNDRPNMSSVVSMLGNELVALPPPKQPAFTAIRIVAETTSTPSNGQKFSLNGLTYSSVEPR